MGRGPANLWVGPEDHLLSREQAIIKQTGHTYRVENLGAVNPTLIWRGMRWQPVTIDTLHDGDIMVLGSSVFRFSRGSHRRSRRSHIDRRPREINRCQQSRSSTFGGRRMARLIVAAPDGTREVVFGTECVIGRGPRNTVSLSHDPKVEQSSRENFPHRLRVQNRGPEKPKWDIPRTGRRGRASYVSDSPGADRCRAGDVD